MRNGQPVSPCEAIVESGERSESSPFRFRGVGPVASADAKGQFRSWYITQGSSNPIARPETVSVYVRVAKGAWEPILVPIVPERTSVVSDTEMHLDLGYLQIPNEIQPYAHDP